MVWITDVYHCSVCENQQAPPLKEDSVGEPETRVSEVCAVQLGV